jgi:DNA polymerase-3 subunit beta
MIVFQAAQEHVLAALQRVAGIVERRHTLPILANVLLVKSGASIELTSSDLEVQIRTQAELGGEAQSYTTTLSARKLQDILRTMAPDQQVTLEDKGGKITLKAGKSRFTLQSLPATDFPLVQEQSDWGDAFTVPQKLLKHLLAQVSFAMAVHDIRYYLNGILFEVDARQLTLVATDGHRLALTRAELSQAVAQRQEVIFPRKTVLELQRLLADTDEPVQLQLASNQARLRFGNIEFVTKLVEGKFPDYNRVVPQSHPHQLALGRQTLLTALQRAAIMTSDKFKGVRLNFDNGGLHVGAHNAEQEEAADELDIDYDGPAIDIGFNVTYLMDVLSHASTDMVNMALADGNSSALFTLPDDPSFKYVVMPMRI